MPLVAGVDSSTQSCTVELRDADSGALVSTGRAKHPVTTPPVSEQTTDQWWLAFASALGEAGAAPGVDLREVAAISVGAQCHGLVALDAHDQLIRPVKLWNDTTAGEDVTRLLAERGQASWVREVLVPLNPALTIAKLAWMSRHEPDNLERIARLMVPHDWLTFALTGAHVTDRSDASGTGYYSADQGRFRADLLREHISDRVDWEATFPTVLGPQDSAGVVRPEVADELGLRHDVIVGPGGGDQHVAAVGMGLGPGEVAFSLGTSGVVFTPAAQLPSPRDWSVDFVCDTTGGYLPLICVLNCTKVTDEFAYLLGVDLGGLEELALADTSGEGPVLLAYLDGERTPMRPGATGTLAGLRSNTTREQLARAAFDGVVQGLIRGMDTLQELAGVPITSRVIAAGGGARSRAYRQFIADRLGQEVITVDSPEATARGACVQAAAVLHGRTVAEQRDLWKPATLTTTEPRQSDGPPVDPRGNHPGVDPNYVALSDAYDQWFLGT